MPQIPHLHWAIIAGVAITGVAFSPSVTAAAPATETAPMNDRVLQELPSPPPLHLSEAQRARIRAALREEDTHVAAKTAKAVADFRPAVGAKLPKKLSEHPFPRPLVYELPELKRYTYAKFKNDVLVINPMSHAIVEVLSH